VNAENKCKELYTEVGHKLRFWIWWTCEQAGKVLLTT
jgi:hypothetical protein